MTALSRLRTWVFLTAMLRVATGLGADAPARDPILRTVDIDIGQSAVVTFSNGAKATVKLLEVQEHRDSITSAIRDASVKVDVDGNTAWISCANYHLPVTLGPVQIDCTITKGYYSNARSDAWGLEKDARLRLWPAGSPWMEPGTFVYPLRQRWFATLTQMSNEPTYVDGDERADHKKTYYHSDLDFGGCEGMVEVIAATDGVILSDGKKKPPGYDSIPVRVRYDEVYVLDDHGWTYRYCHLQSIDAAIHPGAKIKMGDRIGILGKEGSSGGWSHLHFGIASLQPSGKWGAQEAYPFVWEAYLREQKPAIIAVARPHHFARVGEPVTLDASKSWSASGKIASYQWTFTDGATPDGPAAVRVYQKPGQYSEIVKVSDEAGHVAYDFAVVQVIGNNDPKQVPPLIQPAFAPTTNIAPGDSVAFKVRTFRDAGGETWDFGDGTAPVSVHSDGNADEHARDGFAVTQHAFAKAGDYIVRVEHVNSRSEKAIAHLWVRVGQ